MKYKIKSTKRVPDGPVSFEENETVEKFDGPTYGMVQDDEGYLGVKCVAVCKSQDEPFVVMPEEDLEEIS